MTNTQQESAQVLALLANFARRIARDPHDAEDLAQITLIKVWLSWDKDATAEWDDAQFKAWLYQIAKNAWIDTERKRAARQHTDGLTDVHYGPTTIESGVERRTVIGTALSQLPDKQRVALLLVAQGYSYEEIAAQVKVPRTSVKDVLARARKSIKQEWSKVA